jgi:hypothetical protein
MGRAARQHWWFTRSMVVVLPFVLESPSGARA